MQDDSLARAFRLQQMLAAALAAALLVYAIIVEVLSRQSYTVGGVPDTLLHNLRFVFVFLAFAVYFVMRFGQQRILVKKPTDTRQALVAKLSLASLISLVLAELPAVLGLVLFLMSGNRRDFYPLMVISLILLYVAFPRFTIWEVWSQPRPEGWRQESST